MKTIQIFGLILLMTSCSNNEAVVVEPLPQDSKKVLLDSLIDLSDNLLRNGRFNEVLQILDSANQISSQINDSVSTASVLNNYGVLFYRLSRYDESVDYYSKAMDLAIMLNDSANVGARLKNIGMSLKQKGMYQSAIRNYREALIIFTEMGNRREIGSVNNSIGNVYKSLRDYDRALLMYDNALGYWTDVDYESGIALATSNRGNALLDLGRFREAIDSYLESLKIKRKLNNKSAISSTLNNIGEAYFKMGDYENCRKNLESALSIKKEIGDQKGVSLVANNFAALEIELGNFFLADKWLAEASRISEELFTSDIKMENLRLRRILFAKTGDYKKAFEIDIQFDLMKDSAFNDQVVKVKDLQFEYDLEQEEKKNQSFQNDLALSKIREENQQFRSNVQTYIIAAAALTLLIVSYFAYRLRKKNQHIENLIRELHHRVKNHLGMISGMFGAQTGLSDLDAAVLDEAKTRVEAVNGIHRRLYRQDEYEFVNMQEYLEELVDNNALVFGLFNKLNKEIEIKAQVMEIDKAISVGLIANEVLTNAFKYGLQKTDEPVLKIVLEKVVKGYRMVIFNNASSDTSTGRGFGAELINRLAQNLKGSTQVSQKNGFQFELTFP